MSDVLLEDPEYLTVKELAQMLRLKERKIYDLAAAGEVPCSRVTGKLLFPRDQVKSWIEAAAAGPIQTDTQRPSVFLGSHDPLLEWALRQSQCGLATFFDGSDDGLTRLQAGEGVAAGLHLYDDQTDQWNISVIAERFAGQNVVLVEFATRWRGLVVHPDYHDTITSLADLPGRRVALRQPGSGTARVFAHLITQAGLPQMSADSTEIARSELDAVLSVAQGSADVTFGLEPLARQFGLTFVPVIEERFDLLVDREAWFDPALQKLVAFCTSKAFTNRAKAETGYNVTGFGAVRWNG